MKSPLTDRAESLARVVDAAQARYTRACSAAKAQREATIAAALRCAAAAGRDLSPEARLAAIRGEE
jgi:hypothetical protein